MTHPFVRRLSWLAVLVLVSPLAAQWQNVAPGIDYRQYTLTAPDPAPNNVFVARMDRNNTSCIIDSTIATGQLISGRETVGGMFSRYEDTLNYWGGSWGPRSDVVVAINGDGFTSNPGPTNGQIISGSQAKRWPEYSGGSGFCWKLDRTCFLGGNVRNGNVGGHEQQYIYFPNNSSLVPTGVNVARNSSIANELIVYTTQYSDRTYTDNSGVEVLVETTAPLLVKPKGSAQYVYGTVREIRQNLGSTPIPFDHVVLSGKGTYASALLSNCAVGDQIRFQFDIKDYGTGGQVPTDPQDWTDAYASVGCFAYVVKNGIVPSSDWASNSGAIIRNPRTCVAFNDNYVYFVVCDGRSTQSVGMTYTELGNFCVNYLGATWATNQDGGGSSTMIVNGVLKNVPSDGSQRAVANGLVMVNMQPKTQSSAFAVNQQVTTNASANVRLGPGTNYGILTTVASGTSGQIVDHPLKGVFAKGYNWWKVNFNGTKGWVAQTLLVGGGIAPSITVQPSPQSVAPGATAVFSVTAAGDPTLTYQWQKNQANLSNGGHYSGVTTATLTVSNVDLNDAANYRCVVTNPYGSATSNEAALTLTGKPTITQQPQPQNVCTGGTATFTVAASGSGTLTYQWQKNGANLANGGHYSGVTTPTLTVSPADGADAGNYRCAVSNASGTTYSNAAPLTLNLVYAFAGVGLAGSTMTGVSTDGSVAAGNTSAYGFLWSASSGAVGLGAGTVTAGVAIKSGTVVVGGLNGGAASRWNGNAAGVGSWTALPLAGGTTAWTPLCTAASASDVWIGGNTNGSTGTRQACRYKESANSTATLSLPSNGNRDAFIRGLSDTGVYAGQYQYGNTSPSGSRQAMGGGTLVALYPLIGSPSTGNEGVAHAASRDGTKCAGWSWSSISNRHATIWTVANPTAPAAVPFPAGEDYAEVYALSQDGSVAGGYSALAANLAGTKHAILWDAVNGTRDVKTLLTTQYGLDLTGWTLTDVKGMSGDGTVLVGNGTHNGVAEGWVAFLGVPSQAPTITSHPGAQSVCEGASPTFTVAASGVGTLTYQWQRNGVDLVNGPDYSGVTTATLTVLNAETSDAGNYACVVSVGCAATVSNAAALTLRLATEITQQPDAQHVCPGATAVFTVAATGDGTLSYQWQKNEVNLGDGGHYAGTTTPTLTVSNADASDVANYRCVVTGGCGSTIASPAALTLKEPTLVVQQPAPQNVCAGATAVFTVAASGEGALSYQWQKDGIDLADGGHYSGATTDTLTVSGAAPADAGAYRCVVTAACGSANSDAAALTLASTTGADLDCDGDVDGTDFGVFSGCFNGTGNPVSSGCLAADLNGDNAVDGADYGLFSSCFNGSGNPPACP